MPKVYTNADADRQYGRGRQEIGPWRFLRPEIPEEPVESTDEILADAKRALTSPGQLQATIEQGQLREEQDAAQESARRKSNFLTPFFTSVFSPEQRERVAQTIEGDSANREGMIPRVRSFLAGAVGGTGQEGAFSEGAMGLATPVDIGTGLVGPALSRVARPAIEAERAATDAARRTAEHYEGLASAPTVAETPFARYLRPKSREIPYRDIPAASRATPEDVIDGDVLDVADVTPTPPSTPRASAITEPNRLLGPAFSATPQSPDVNRVLGRKPSNLIPEFAEMSDLDLAREVAKEQAPGVNILNLLRRPIPSGEGAAKALRQREHMARSIESKRLKAAETDTTGVGVGSSRWDDEAGFADPQLLGFAARTGGGALFGAAKPEYVGADEGERVEGGVKGALLGALLPSIARGVGRLGKSAGRIPSEGVGQFGRQAFDEVQNLRYMGALSGKAIPKSFLNNLGAPFVAGAERSISPRPFFRRQLGTDFAEALRDPSIVPQTSEQKQAVNLFGRVLGAGDYASTRGLERMNLDVDDAERYLLRTPIGKLGFTGPVGNFLSSRGGKAALLFQTAPLNQAVHGGSAAFGVQKNLPASVSPNRARALALAFGGLGAAQAYGGVDPVTTALTSPLASVYQLPLLAGNAAGHLAKGAPGVYRQVMRGVSPVPELGMDIVNPAKFFKPIYDPAVESYFGPEEESGKRPVRSRRAARPARRRRPVR